MRKTAKHGKFRNKTRKRQKGGNVFNSLITREEVLAQFAETIKSGDDKQINKYSQEALAERLEKKNDGLTPLNVVIVVIDNKNPDHDFNETVYHRATGIYYCVSDLITKKNDRTKKLLGSSNTDDKLFAWMKANVLDVVMGDEYVKDVSFQAISLQDLMDKE